MVELSVNIQLSAAADSPVSRLNAAGTFPLFTIVNNRDVVWAGVTVTGPKGAMIVAWYWSPTITCATLLAV